METKNSFYLFKEASVKPYLLGRFCLSFGAQIITFTAGLQLYKITNDPASIALVGVAEFLPILLFSIFAGVYADKHDRLKQALFAQFLKIASTSFLLLASLFNLPPFAFYLGLFGVGLGRAFNDPAFNSLPAGFLPQQKIAQISTLTSAFWQIAAISGPLIAGILVEITKNFAFAYSLSLIAFVIVVFSLLRIKPTIPYTSSKTKTFKAIKEGISYIASNKLILSVITLDLFVVLLGSVTALIPIYAYSVYQVGEAGASAMRMALFTGALAMSLIMSMKKNFKHAGISLLVSVLLFGALNIVFGMVNNFILALLILAITGALDGVSVIIRSTIMQVFVPAQMRGRVSSINTIFISASNEIGDFESGLVASAFRSSSSIQVAANSTAILGGILSMAAVGLIAWKWPELGKLKSLSKTDT